MAATTVKTRIQSTHKSDLREVVIQHNNLITAFDILLAKLDLDAGVSDANYAALAGATSAKIANGSGTVIVNNI